MEEPSADDVPSFDACDRFFSIHELVSLLLHQASPLALVNCQRVCRLWTDIIAKSTELQQNLFLEPMELIVLEDGSQPAAHLNPVLWECFGPVLARKPDENGNTTSARSMYHDLRDLPWARDGETLEAPARMAFARQEASWRKMLVSQPPIQRFDMWHDWWFEGCEETNSAVSAFYNGWDHYYHFHDNITLGFLWDLLESNLKHGCNATVCCFPAGASAAIDPNSTRMERSFEEDQYRWRHREFSVTLPRVKITTRHECRSSKRYCRLDSNVVDDSRPGNERWSKSEGFTWCAMQREAADPYPGDR